MTESNDRTALREAGARLAEELGLPVPSGAPGLDAFALEAGFGSLLADPALPPADRMVAVLSALAQKDRQGDIAAHIRPAVKAGLEAREIREIFVQCGLYGGLPMAAHALNTLNAQLGYPDREEEDARDLAALEADGRATMHGLHGERAETGYAAPGNAGSAGLYRIAILYGYGAIWHRPGLSHRRRMIVALASMAVLGLHDTLAKFAASARAMGLTPAEIAAAIAQTAPYAGFPPALNALGRLADVLAEPGG